MNQRAMKSAVNKMLDEFRRSLKSVDAQPVSEWPRGRLSGALDMWTLVRAHMKPGGAVWESKRYKALEESVNALKAADEALAMSANNENDEPRRTIRQVIKKAEALL